MFIYNDDKDQFEMSGKGIHLVFKCQEGLCAHDLSPGVNLLNTVEENKKLFTKRQVAQADLAKQLCEDNQLPKSERL